MTTASKYFIAIAFTCLCATWPIRAQILQGEWVDASQADIEQHRKTDVTVIVLDQHDRAVHGANVELTQRRHDFVLGVKVPADRPPPKGANQIPVYRCFNAIALDRYTDWSAQPIDGPGARHQHQAVWQSALQPIRTHYGRVISADPARNPDRLALLEPTNLRDAVLKRIEAAASHPFRPDDYDLVADLLQQNIIERKLGQGMLYRMVERAQAEAPKASFGLRVHDVLSRQRGRDLANLLQKLQVRQIQLSHLTIEQPLNGPIQPNALKRIMDQSISSLELPVTLVLDVGGATPIASAINLEAVLRLAFAEPTIAGIYFAGLVDHEFLESNAGLLDETGKPTASGAILDRLFTTLWRSHETLKTDERGNAQTRIFTGWYDIIAVLPNGTQITSLAYIPKSDRAKLIILQATTAETK